VFSGVGSRGSGARRFLLLVFWPSKRDVRSESKDLRAAHGPDFHRDSGTQVPMESIPIPCRVCFAPLATDIGIRDNVIGELPSLLALSFLQLTAE
jgi:hypothetical protein